MVLGLEAGCAIQAEPSSCSTVSGWSLASAEVSEGSPAEAGGPAGDSPSARSSPGVGEDMRCVLWGRPLPVLRAIGD